MGTEKLINKIKSKISPVWAELKYQMHRPVFISTS